MKLRSLHLKNYRIHRELRVEFDERRTLIGGPNECGKSTLVEALHRAFFLRAKGNTEFHRAMSSLHGGEPEVEVEFSVHGKTYRLRKRFGSRGTTTLVREGGETLSGDEAESEVARLLCLGEPVTGKAVAVQWGHIWVRQGFGGDDPTEDATAQQATLLQRLQEMGGAIAVQSTLDSELADRFHAAKDSLFVGSGKPRAGSELERAQFAAAEAEAARQEAEARLHRSFDAMREFDEASRAIVEATAGLSKLGEQRQALEERSRKVEALRRTEADQIRTLGEVSKQLAELETIHAKVNGIAGEIQRLTADLAPREAIVEKLRTSAEAARTAMENASREYDAGLERSRQQRAVKELFQAAISFREQERFLADLTERQKKVDELRAREAGLREELARLPEVDDARLETLRNLLSKRDTLQAAVRAMAASLDVIETDVPIFVGGRELTPGQELHLSEDTEIAIGERVRVRIRPGGGDRLAQARNDLQAASRAYADALAKAGVDSIESATEVAVKRRNLNERIQSTAASLAEWDPEKLATQLAAAKEGLAAAEAEFDRRRSQSPDVEIPSGLADIRTELGRVSTALREMEQAETALKSARDAAAAHAKQQDEQLSTAVTAIDAARQKIRDRELELRLLEETHGNNDARDLRLKKLREDQSTAANALKATQAALGELGAEHLSSDVERIQRAIDAAQTSLGDARTRLAVAQSTLRSDGSDDPQADLENAVAREQSAQTHLAAVRRRAEAIRMLSDLFAQEQRALADQFTQPLADTISGYLECLFGPGTRAKVVFDEQKFQGLQLVRRSHGGAAFKFETLSGGAKEQVAAAVRLAMAEILCTGFGGCLPVIFDDAFAYSDPDRVQTLQRMLDLAASRGLQVIVLTCNPSDYVALGARQTLISPTTVAASSSPTVEAGGSGDDEEVADSSVSEEEKQEFLTKLANAGGSAGNQSLREALGWSESTYMAVKQALLDAGEIVSGRGRGGSVSLSHLTVGGGSS